MNRLQAEAEANNCKALVRLLTRPDYTQLLRVATSELFEEVPHDDFTSFRAYIYGSLLSTLCARVDAREHIPASFPRLIRFVVAAMPEALYPPTPDDTHGHWTHPINFLRRGDPLYEECRDILLSDVHWSPDVHSLMPKEVQERQLLLARILWSQNVHIEHIFKTVCSFVPAAVHNTSAKYASQTVLGIANGMGVSITQGLWEKVALEAIAMKMSEESGTFVRPDQPRSLDFLYPSIPELDGVHRVPELLPSGKTCGSVAFEEDMAKYICDDIKERTVTVRSPSALKALGLSCEECKVAMTKEQLSELQDIAEAGTSSSIDGNCKDWLVIDDNNAVNDAIEGPDLGEFEDFF